MILVLGRNGLVYEGDPGSPAASILETKLFINSIISDDQQGAGFMSSDLKLLFLDTPMLWIYENLHSICPQDIFETNWWTKFQMDMYT